MIERNNILQEFSDELYRYIFKRVRNEDIAEDIRQDVLIKIYQKLSSIKERKKLRPWIYSITRNTIIDFYRKQENIFDYTFSDTLLVTRDNQMVNNICCLRPFIQSLPKTYKRTFILSEIQGNSHKDISKKLNISVTASKSRIQRARNILRFKLISCCKYKLNNKGNISYEHECSVCKKVVPILRTVFCKK
jgi:RNA polymerase sigma-70 factor (ECF subfamily)